MISEKEIVVSDEVVEYLSRHVEEKIRVLARESSNKRAWASQWVRSELDSLVKLASAIEFDLRTPVFDDDPKTHAAWVAEVYERCRVEDAKKVVREAKAKQAA